MTPGHPYIDRIGDLIQVWIWSICGPIDTSIKGFAARAQSPATKTEILTPLGVGDTGIEPVTPAV